MQRTAQEGPGELSPGIFFIRHTVQIWLVNRQLGLDGRLGIDGIGSRGIEFWGIGVWVVDAGVVIVSVVTLWPDVLNFFVINIQNVCTPLEMYGGHCVPGIYT